MNCYYFLIKSKLINQLKIIFYLKVARTVLKSPSILFVKSYQKSLIISGSLLPTMLSRDWVEKSTAG